MIKILKQLSDLGIDSVIVVPGKKEVQFGASVTDAQKLLAAPIIATYDWSQGADDAYQKELAKQSAKDLVNSSDPRDIAFRALMQVMLDEINILRTAAKLQPRVMGQLSAALNSKIDSVAGNG